MGRAIAAPARAARIASAAGCIRAQWKGADTGSGTARLAPFALAISIAFSTAGLGAGNARPARRHCHWRSGRPRRRLRGRRWRWPARPRTRRRGRGHRALADRNRRLHRRAAEAQEARRIRDGERARGAERRIFPERMAGDEGGFARDRARLRFPERGGRPRNVAISAGCALAVSVSSASGPSKIVRLSFSPSAASTASKTSRATGN